MAKPNSLLFIFFLLKSVIGSTLLLLVQSVVLGLRFLVQAARKRGASHVDTSEPLFSHGRGYELYKGSVWHHRRKPIPHSFTYSVRYALVDLDVPPAWFTRTSAVHHMTAEEARSFAGTAGHVRLLTSPVSVGYEQNPISVYYCYDSSDALVQCIAEVTNTPWGERVTFCFNPHKDAVPKPLHVSPFMDMHSTWHFRTAAPGPQLSLVIALEHPELGRYFTATLRLQRVGAGAVRSPEAFLWLMPHRVGTAIYWQALKLWWKGVPLLDHPKYTSRDEYQLRTVERDQKERRTAAGMASGGSPGCPIRAPLGTTKAATCPYVWRPAPSWPWNIS